VIRIHPPRPFFLMKTKPFQFRWNEKLGKSECPYMRRFVLLIFDFGIRLHVWKRSDDKRYFHNHPWWFFTFVLKGSYSDYGLNTKTGAVTIDELKQFSFRFRNADHYHFVKVPPKGAITLVISGPPMQNWGFWINNRMMRPLRFFSRYGHPPCSEQ
jgi:hypothetical protein